MKAYLKISSGLISLLLCTLLTAQSIAQDTANELAGHVYWPGKDFVSLQSVADLKILGNEFGGYIVAKNMGENVYRLNYTSEMGLTIFDLEITPDSTRIIHIIENLNKQSLINKIGLIFKVFLFNYAYGEENLKKVVDKRNTLHFKVLKENWKYFYDPDNKLSRKQFKKGCKRVNVFYSDFQDHGPGKIFLKESGIFRLTVKLKILKYKTFKE